jgi:hypothetical protein
MKKRTRRFDEGGGIREGRNANIDDDTRKRAMAMIAKLNAAEEEEKAPVVSKPVAPPARMERRPLPERRVSPGGPEGGLDYADAPRRVSPGGPGGGLDYADAPRRAAPAARSLVDQIPGYTGKNAGTLGKGPARNPSEAERLVTNALYSSPGGSRMASTLGRFGKGLTELFQAGRAGWKAGKKEKADERTAQEVAKGSRQRVPSSFERMADEAPQRIMPKRPPAPKKDTLRQARTKKQTARKNEEMQDELTRFADEGNPNFKRGGKVSSASRRADGIAMRGKTRGRVL